MVLPTKGVKEMKKYREVKAELCKCNYCGSQVLTIDDIGQCPRGSPGNMTVTGLEETIHVNMVTGFSETSVNAEDQKQTIQNHPELKGNMILYHNIREEIPNET